MKKVTHVEMKFLRYFLNNPIKLATLFFGIGLTPYWLQAQNHINVNSSKETGLNPYPDSLEYYLKEKQYNLALTRIIPFTNNILKSKESDPKVLYETSEKIYQIQRNLNVCLICDSLIRKLIDHYQIIDSTELKYKLKSILFAVEPIYGIKKTSIALEYLKNALLTNYYTYKIPDEILTKIYFYLGHYYNEIGNSQEALSYLDTSLIITNKLYGNNSLNSSNILFKIGLIYKEKLDHESAIDYFIKSELILSTIKPTDSNLLARILHQHANSLRFLNQIKKAIEVFEQSRDIKQLIYEPYNGSLLNTLLDLGDCHLVNGEFVKAYNYFNYCYLTYSTNKNDQSDLAYYVYPFARYYQYTKNYDLAFKYYKECIDLMLKNNVSHYSLGPLYLECARAAIEIKKYSEAMSYLNKDIEGLLKYENSFKFPNSIFAYFELARLNKKQYQETLIDSFITNSIHNYEIVVSKFKDFIEYNSFEITEQKLIQRTYAFFESYIDFLNMLNSISPKSEYKDKMWSLSEYLHGVRLLKGLALSKAKKFANFPIHKLEKEKELNQNILKYKEKRHLLLTVDSLDLKNPLVLKAELELNMAIRHKKEFLEELENTYPLYFGLKFFNSDKSISKFQANLNNDQTILEYFTGDSSIFLFLIKKNESKVFKFKKDSLLELNIEKLNKSITSYYTIINKTSDLYQVSIEDYSSAARYLYNHLLSQVISDCTSNLIMIPDAALASIPFEALLPSTPRDLSNFKTYDYLVKNYNISYSYSAATLLEMQNITSKAANKSLLALAPFYDANGSNLNSSINKEVTLRFGLTSLPYSGIEVSKILNKFKGTKISLLGKHATKKAFLENASKCRILHLATHGKSNSSESEFSFLAFSNDTLANGLLTVAELYNIPIQAHLVCLSACESAQGNKLKGEGMISLARAFAYSGAKSIVASLWKVNDKSTMQLMEGFYHELFQFKNKDFSLANAKRDFLKNNPGTYGHPFYWSGFIAIGDMNPLSK